MPKFIFRKETEGAYCYDEVDDKGEVLGKKDPKCIVGSLYIRKTSDIGKKKPTAIEATLKIVK